MAELIAARHILDDPAHAPWLADQTDRLLDFYVANAPDRIGGGFFALDEDGRALPVARELYLAARMTYCFALGHQRGRVDCAELVQHGLSALRGAFEDGEFGGWFSSPDHVEGPKQTYAHAFVLLAASTAAQAGFATTGLMDRITAVFTEHLWDPEDGLNVESWDRRWQECEAYRGLNANMHSLEAFIAGYESTGDEELALRATSIAQRMVAFTEVNQWRVPEHFDAAWEPLPGYNDDNRRDQFRPFGTTPGHSFEWARLLIQLWTGARAGWMLDAAEQLFVQAIRDGWDDAQGGLYYTVDGQGRPVVEQRLHWPLAEAIGAAYYLYRVTGKADYADWYARFWSYADQHFIDHERGGWYHERAADGSPSSTIWVGKPDLYHALQATMYIHAHPELPPMGKRDATGVGRPGEER
jgi:sulfoquinovose isomerase